MKGNASSLTFACFMQEYLSARKISKRYDLAREIASASMQFDRRVVTTSKPSIRAARADRESEENCSCRALPLTGVKGDLADHNPSRSEAESQLDELADPMVQLDRDVSRMLEDPVLHIGVHDRITSVISAADAEHNTYLGKYLKYEGEKKHDVLFVRKVGAKALFRAIELD